MIRRALRPVLAALVLLAAALAVTPARAQAFLGWQPLAELHVGSRCSAHTCQTELPTGWRHPSYALATDAPLGMTMTGRLAFVCEGGSEQVALLPSIPAAGAVATVGNPCPGYAAKRVTARVESVSIPGADEAKGANLRIFGSLN